MKKLYQILIATAFVVAMDLTSYAHPGRTDASGGHYNRKTGEYHYHNSGSKPSTSTPTSSTPSLSTSQPSTPSEKPPTPTTATAQPIKITENHWQVALNNNFFNGKLEVPVSTGRVDIATETLVVEVDKVSKYTEGIEQALKYAQATGKKPVLALYIDGEKDGFELLQQADKLCKEKGVSLLLANCYVSVNDLITLISVANPVSFKTTGESNVSDESEKKLNSDSSKTTGELNYWLNTNSSVRHNSSCRYYKNTKNGRTCSKDEGRACGICGG